MQSRRQSIIIRTVNFLSFCRFLVNRYLKKGCTTPLHHIMSTGLIKITWGSHNQLTMSNPGASWPVGKTLILNDFFFNLKYRLVAYREAYTIDRVVGIDEKGQLHTVSKRHGLILRLSTYNSKKLTRQVVWHFWGECWLSHEWYHEIFHLFEMSLLI